MTDQPMAFGAISRTPAARLQNRLPLLARLTGGATLRAWAQPVTFLGLGMLVVIYAMLAFLIVSDRTEATANAVKNGRNLVRIIDQAYANILQGTDSTLMIIRRAYAQAPTSLDLETLFNNPPEQAGLERRYVVADAQGRVIASTLAAADGGDFVGKSYPDIESFQRHKNASDDELLISPPRRLHAAAPLDIFLTRRLTAADGSFAGIVAAVLDTGGLTRVGAQIDLGPQGTFGLIGTDGVVRARAVESKVDPGTIGRKFAPSTGVIAHVLHAPNGHFWNTPGMFDEVSRLVTYQVIGDYPVIATVTTAEAEIFRHANKQARVYWLIALLGTAVVLIGIKWGVAREQKLNAAASNILAAKDNLRNSEERYRLVEDAVNEGIWDWNIETDACYRSPNWRRILGYSKADAPATMAALTALIHPNDRAAVEAALQAHLAHQTPYTVEFRLKAQDGEYRWVQSRGKARRDADGRPTRMLGTLADITERKRAEASLRENHANLARAEMTAQLGHFRYVKATDEYTWSDGVFRIVGKSPASYTPSFQSAPDFLVTEDRPLLRRQREHILSGGAPHPLTLRLIREDGQMIYIESWLEATRGSDGSITGMFGSIQDVTARKLAELDLKESRDNLARAERLALLGHFKSGLQSDSLVWSDGVYAIFGFSPESYAPNERAFVQMVLPEDRPILKRAVDEVIAGGQIPNLVIRVRRSDGAIIDLELWIQAVRGNDGAITGLFGTMQDVSLRRRTEELLARDNQELEARVSERTNELAHEMRRREEAQMTLGQMQKMEAVGQLTAGVAHDFNNLLSVIGGSLEFVDRSAARGLTADPELLDAALRATRRGRELVRRLLAFSRQTPLRAEPTPIDQMVLDTLRLLQRTLGHSVDIVTQLNAKGAVVSVDRNQLANALLNLALNARDAMPEGGQMTIATECRPCDPALASSSRWATGEEVRIVISDTGAGMSEEVRRRATEPFFTTKADGLGSGLGLSMVQGFVEQSGGLMSIDSAPEQGTAVTIRLPRIAASSAQTEPGDPALSNAAPAREKTVLLVEDDADVRIVITAQLRHLGYRVQTAANGMEAIDLIASPAHIDVVLTDIVLPGGLDGVSLVKEAMAARPRIAVLCMSGYEPSQKHRKWLGLQNIGFLEKPFHTQSLAQALEAALVN
ncbi:MAG: PAS domain-containing protein [Pseudolabrys sp.]|nr:PAS domain-containing protein [Pseudolabrys sp.]